MPRDLEKELRVAKKKKLAQIHQDIKLFFGDTTAGSAKWATKHLCDLIYKNNDRDRIEALHGYFKKTQPSQKVEAFYYWCKDHPLSKKDLYVYDVYTEVVKGRVRENMIQINDFSVLGERLYTQLEEWKGDSETCISDVIVDYLQITLAMGLEWNRTLLYTPKCILGSYGWGAFEDEIKSRGGKSSILKPSKEKQNTVKKEREMIDEIDEITRTLIQQGDIELADEIGKSVTRKGLAETYRMICTDETPQA